MAKIEIQVDDNILSEASRILHSLGMDVEMAVNILLRRTIIEKGLPMTMTTPSLEPRNKITRVSGRSKLKITPEMVDEVWKAFLRYINGAEELTSLSKQVSLKTGMKNGSASIYLNFLANLVNEKPNTRALKFEDVEYLMSKIRTELGDDLYRKALKSLKKSIPYWRKNLSDSFADKIEEYCEKHLKTFNNT